MLDSQKLIGLALLAAVSGTASPAYAHFHLLSPDSWLNEDSSGGPQKGSPCGTGGSDDVSPAPMSGKVTEYHAGEEIEVKWVDTIAHPGHFRIALAENRADLKDPMIQQDSFCSYDEDMVKAMTPSGNVLAEAVSFRSKTGFSAQAGTMFSQKVTLPNKPCDKCTLQVLQVMENDIQSISNCYYHHCADIKILPAEGGAAGTSAAAGTGAAAGASGSSTAGAAGGSAGSSGTAATAAGSGGSTSAASGTGAVGRAGSSATTSAGTGAGMIASTAGTSATTAGSTATGSAGTAATGTTTNAVTGMMGAPTSSADSSGCSVVRVGTEHGTQFGFAGVGVLFLLSARRRRRELRSRR